MNNSFIIAGVMGWPVAHSRSPLIHNHWIQQYNLTGAYGAFPVEPSNLEAAIRGIQALGLAGCNITIPHKVNAMAYVDWVHPLAQRMGAINTVVVQRDGALHGFNNDGFGFIQSLLEAQPTWQASASPIVVLGAGGAARDAGAAAAQGADMALTGWQAVTAALADYAAKARDIGGDIGSALVGAFTSAENAIGDFVKTGKLDFRDLVTSMIADLAQLAGIVTTVITQNVDGLHQLAGSTDVIDLHGRLDRVRCMGCGVVTTREHMDKLLAELNPQVNKSADFEFTPDGDAEIEAFDGFRFPNCESCNGILKPDVVFFGEQVPTATAEAAMAALDSADALIVAGSSLSVNSGLRFVKRAHRSGKPVVIVNLGPTKGDSYALAKIEASTSLVLDRLLND